jgi:hypothetical protein
VFRQCCSSRRTMSSPWRAVDLQCTRCSPSPVWYSRGAVSSSPLAAMLRLPSSLSPSQFPPSDGRVRGMIRGVTVSAFVDVKALVIATSPNESATRTCSGPRVYFPRSKERTWYRSDLLEPARTPSSTNRGLSPNACGSESSASSSPVRSRDTLDSFMVSSAGCPACTRAGSDRREQESLKRARPAPNAEKSGSMTSSNPMRSKSGSGISSPRAAATMPAPTNHLPRVVSAPNNAPIAPTPARSPC